MFYYTNCYSEIKKQITGIYWIILTLQHRTILFGLSNLNLEDVGLWIYTKLLPEIEITVDLSLVFSCHFFLV